jgi:hypothetical protein
MLTVYFLETQYAYMGWNHVFLELVNYLRDVHGAKVIHQKGGHLFIEKFNYKLPDCELVIHDEKNDILRAISWAEWKTGLLDIFKTRKNKDDIFMQTQFSNWFPLDLDKSIFPFKLKGTTFYTFRPEVDHEFYYQKRKQIKYCDMIDKIFFLFTTRREDPFKLRELGLCSESTCDLSNEDYLDLGIQYKLGLSISSVGEITYREIEYMAIGVPNLRLQYGTQLDPPLIPNYHYISVERKNIPFDVHLDRAGGEAYVEAYKQRFLEVKDNYEFLEFITNNAREYYIKYCSPPNRLKHVLNSLEL